MIILYSIVLGRCCLITCLSRSVDYFIIMRIPVYNVWRSMKSRCYYAKNKNYTRYWARWITVCDEWKNSYNIFESFCIENWWSQWLQLDRKDNDKWYYPENCRFCTPKENARNRWTNKVIVFNWIELTYAWWAEYIWISKYTFISRIRQGLSIERIIEIWKRWWKECWISKRTSPVFTMLVWDEIIVDTKKERDSIYACWFAKWIKIKTRKIWNRYKLVRV